MNRQLLSALAVALLVLVVVYFQSQRQAPNPQPPPPAADTETSPHLLMGNPSGATTDPAHPDNYLLRKEYFALSYNDAKGTPNWVSWCVRAEDLGHAPRPDQFQVDKDLPKGFRVIRPTDYTGSGFDRGHMCPAADRAASPEATAATFVMTNMVPQAQNLNREAWADFEIYCRDLVRHKHHTLYIVAGPAGRGGTGAKGHRETISGDRLTVPAKCWKVVLAIPDGTGTADDVGRVGPGCRVLAVVMPNEETVGHGWAKHRTSVQEVEALTGYTFFSAVPADVIGPLKTRTRD